MAVLQHERIRPHRPDEVWTLDFVANQLVDGRKFRALTVVDVYTREELAIEIGPRLRCEDVVATLDRVAFQRHRPNHLFVDNGREFSGRLLNLWAYHHKCASTLADPESRPTTATWKC